MSPVQRLLVGAIVLVTGVGGFAAGRAMFRPSAETAQPIAFDHRKHARELEVGCDVCHELYATSQHAGLPSLTLCLGCHEDAQTELAEEQKIRDLAAAGQDDVFRKLFRLPDHVFYSHRRHAAIGQIPCQTCHGAIAETTTPPQRPLVDPTMSFCVRCHERSGASEECTACHR